MHFKGNSANGFVGTHGQGQSGTHAGDDHATGAMTAETESGGVQLNYVPKDGGNTFRVSSDVDLCQRADAESEPFR